MVCVYVCMRHVYLFMHFAMSRSVCACVCKPTDVAQAYTPICIHTFMHACIHEHNSTTVSMYPHL